MRDTLSVVSYVIGGIAAAVSVLAVIGYALGDANATYQEDGPNINEYADLGLVFFIALLVAAAGIAGGALLHR